MKFAIAYVIGDTELHDKLCLHYGSRTEGVKCLCRHCNCSTEDLVDPTKQHLYRLWNSSDFKRTDNEGNIRGKEYWKSISHHPLSNAFHDINFGENENGIHLATPGETLHMHQLGVAKRAVESFSCIIGEGHAHQRISRLQVMYGSMLSRQSERDFPRTNFSTAYLSTTKKEGKHYAGIILLLILAIISPEGEQTVRLKTGMRPSKITDLVYTLELILFMEEFLKHFKMKLSQSSKLPVMIEHFIEKINKNCQRGGMGTRLIKNHLYFHLPKYIELWGPPSGWDSGPSESFHKYEVKAPSKNTQQNARSIINQTILRQAERQLLMKVKQPLIYWEQNISSPKRAGGSRYRLSRNKDGKPSLQWEKKSLRDKGISLPQAVITYVCD